MKIMIDISAGLNGVGGVATYIKELISHLLLQNCNHEYLLLINSLQAINKFKLTESLLSLPKHKLLLPRSFLSQIWMRNEFPSIECFTGSIDVFHAPHVLLPPLKRAKGILTVHDCTFFKYPHYFSNQRFSYREYKELLPSSLKRAFSIVVDSETTRRDLLDCFVLDERKVNVVPLGVSEKFFTRPVSVNDVASSSNPSNTPNTTNPYTTNSYTTSPYNTATPAGNFILSVIGTPEPRKNLSRLLQAHRIFVEKGNAVPLWVVTSKAAAMKLAPNAVPASFLNKHVRFLDNIPINELITLLHDCYIFAYPSLYEGFGLPVLEAMAGGCAVVAGNCGALPEIVGEAGMLVDPESPEAIALAFLKLVEDESLRTSFKAAAIKRAKEFSWEKTACLMTAIYEEAGSH